MIIVYGINLSTFTRKVRLALTEKDVPYRLEVAPMGSARVKALHPLGRIPVIEHHGRAIPDSSVIIAYLERAFPERPLYPADHGALAQALWLEEYADTRLREVTVPFFAENVVKPLFQGRPADEEALAQAEIGRDECCDFLENELQDKELGEWESADPEFLVGNTLTVADIAVGAQLITYQQGGGIVPATRWPLLARYLDGLQSRPCWAAMLAEETESLNQARARRR